MQDLLITSIPPLPEASSSDKNSRTYADQSRVLNSFRASGFDVASVNSADEIESLQPLFADVRFILAEPAEAVFPDRYGPSIGSTLAACVGSESCAIVNADIYLLESDIRDLMRRNPGSFFVARRLDVDRFGGDFFGVYGRGIDAVFFVPDRFAALIEDRDVGRFQLGAPFWDLVVPIIASFHGPVTFVEPPFILHQVHTPKFSNHDYELLRKAAIGTLIRHAAAQAERSVRARAFMHLVDRYVGSRGDNLDRRAVRRMSTILDFWMSQLEMEPAEKVQANLDDVLSPRSLERIAAGELTNDTEAADRDAAAEASIWRRWITSKPMSFRERKRRRRRRILSRLLDDIGHAGSLPR